MPKFRFDDGGRAKAGYKGFSGDCVCRAIAIAAEMPYQEVYDLLDRAGASEKKSSKRKGKSSARTGVYKSTIRKVMENLGWRFTATMGIGTGCRVHLKADELPTGRLVASVSRHSVAVVDGVIHDTHDCSRGGKRCVYGYWSKS